MDFWGAEVEEGKVVTVTDAECPIVITQMSLNKRTDGGSVVLYVTVDGKRFVIGTLSPNIPQISCELAFEKEFSLSHSLETGGSVYFVGHSVEKREDSMPIAKPPTSTVKKRTCKSLLQPCSSSKTKTAKEKYEEKKIKKEEDSCCFGCKDSYGNNSTTIFVKGFQHLRPRDEIKDELSNIFGSCGKITRDFVPTQCVTCVPLGFAFINLLTGQKEALKLNGTYMGGRKLKVKMAINSDEYYGYDDFEGCGSCQINIAKHRPPIDSKYAGYYH